MPLVISAFVPSVAQLYGLAAVMALALACVAVSAAILGRRRMAEADLVHGWAVFGLLFTALGTLTPFKLTWVLIASFTAAAAGGLVVLWRSRRLIDSANVKAMVLALPLLVVVAAMVPSQWDEFTQWLPNARHVFETDRFPGRDGPPLLSAAPAYPYGLPLIIYMASRMAGVLVENAAALFNALLLAAFGLACARAMHQALNASEPAQRLRLGLSVPTNAAPGWGLAALGVLAATAFNTTFVPKIVFTAYADTATSVAAGFVVLLVWRLVNAIADEARDEARRTAWQIGLVGAALINLKQANVAILGAILAGGLLVALADRRVSSGAVLGGVLRALVLPIVLYAMWRLYVIANLAGGEFALNPLVEWRWHRIDDIVARMARIASQKGGYFGTALIAVGFGLRAAARGVCGPFDRMAIVVGTSFILYNLFLLFSYVASFGEYEALRAASYWRYNMHLGCAATLFAAYGLAGAWRLYGRPALPRWIVVVPVLLALLSPAALIERIRFDLRLAKFYVRDVGAEIARIVPPGARLAIFDPTDNGFYGVLLRYTLHHSAEIVLQVSSFSTESEAELGAKLGERGANHAWVHVPTPAIERVLGVALAAQSSYLLARNEDRWTIARAWPYPGYLRPTDLPD